MPIQDDFSVAVNGDIRYTGGATIRYELRWKHFANEWAWESIATNLDSTTGAYTQSATIAWTPGTGDRGNVSANYSERVTFTTAATGIILPRAPVSFSQPRAPRVP